MYIKRLGKIVSGIISAILAITLICSGCAKGRGDWSYELTGGYWINRLSGQKIILEYRESSEASGGTPVIRAFFVTDFCFNQQYIAVKGIPMKGTELLTEQDFEREDRFYYLVETSSHSVFGPYNEEEFLVQCDDLSVGDFGKWQNTREMDYSM